MEQLSVLTIRRYHVQNTRLTPWIRCFWYLEQQGAEIDSQLLPTDHIDVMVNLGAPMVYHVGDTVVSAPWCHINGLRSGHSRIVQSGYVKVLGISFYAYGLYPFTGRPVTEIRDRIVDLQDFAPALFQDIRDIGEKEPEKSILRLEQVLLGHLDTEPAHLERMALVQRFLGEAETVQAFCNAHGVHRKAFERICLRYTGYPPLQLWQLRRFQNAGNQVVHRQDDSLAEVAYANGYADQAHLTRMFRRLAGHAPQDFRQRKRSVKANVRYEYE